MVLVRVVWISKCLLSANIVQSNILSVVRILHNIPFSLNALFSSASTFSSSPNSNLFHHCFLEVRALITLLLITSFAILCFDAFKQHFCKNNKSQDFLSDLKSAILTNIPRLSKLTHKIGFIIDFLQNLSFSDPDMTLTYPDIP